MSAVWYLFCPCCCWRCWFRRVCFVVCLLLLCVMYCVACFIFSLFFGCSARWLKISLASVLCYVLLVFVVVAFVCALRIVSCFPETMCRFVFCVLNFIGCVVVVLLVFGVCTDLHLSMSGLLLFVCCFRAVYVLFGLMCTVCVNSCFRVLQISFAVAVCLLCSCLAYVI